MTAWAMRMGDQKVNVVLNYVRMRPFRSRAQVSVTDANAMVTLRFRDNGELKTSEVGIH